MNFPENLKYTKDHEWILVDGEFGTVGITEYAQGELGDVVFLDIPTVGKAVKVGDSFGTIEAVKAVSELYAPVSGTVMELNPNLESQPELVNKEPYDGGWMVKIKMTNKSDLNNLLDSANYRKLICK
jgi:glycine cleavage system H protein